MTGIPAGVALRFGSSHDNQTSHFYDELRERLSLLCRKGGKKGRKKSEVDAAICWLTGYN